MSVQTGLRKTSAVLEVEKYEVGDANKAVGPGGKLTLMYSQAGSNLGYDI